MKAQRLSLNHEKVHVGSLRKFLESSCHTQHWAKTALGHLRARNWKALLDLASNVEREFDHLLVWPEQSHDSSTMADFKLGAQFVAMVKKYPYTAQQMPGLDPDEAALAALLKSERRNRRVNSVLRAYRVRGVWRHKLHPMVKDVMHKVLGESPPLHEIYPLCDNSNGASVGVTGNATHIGVKWTPPIAVTPSAAHFFVNSVLANYQVSEYFIRLAGLDPESLCPLGRVLYTIESVMKNVKYVQNNEICCVPKRWDRARTIAKEPAGNNFIQKGIDLWMRKRLLSVLNLDLSDQSVNQVMAREGSLEGVLDPYVTIDVKDASNGILIELVRTCAPEEWFTFLNSTRSPSGKWPDGAEKRYELFSSMGNGFTFPLETLFFAACCIAAYRYTGMKPDFRVYGDDIIVRQSVALVVIELLKSFGLRINTDKTFVFGPFRESCGANWYAGKSVTPIYWDNHICDRVSLMQMHNAMLHVCEDTSQYLRSLDPGLPYVVPDDAQYAWITDQAFRVPQDVWLTHENVVWRRDTWSWRYPLLIAESLPDAQFGTVLPGLAFKEIWWTAVLRGATPPEPFPLRKSVRYRPAVAQPDSKLECNFAHLFRGFKLSYSWDGSALQTLQSLRRAGLRGHRLQKQMTEWYGR